MTMRTQELFGFTTPFSRCVEARFTAEQVLWDSIWETVRAITTFFHNHSSRFRIAQFGADASASARPS